MWMLLTALTGCWGDQAFILEGTVVKIDDQGVLVDHGEIARLGPAGIAHFAADDTTRGSLTPGDRITARLDFTQGAARIAKVRKTGKGVIPAEYRGDPVRGVVVEVKDANTVVIDHEEIPGVMMAMVMPFSVDDSSGMTPGDTIRGRMEIRSGGAALLNWRVEAKGEAPITRASDPLGIGEVLPTATGVAEDGSPIRVGAGQGIPTLVTFLYTRCPVPEFCPATIAKLQAVQAVLGDRRSLRLVAITLDPEHDTPAVLGPYAQAAGADPEVWRFAVLDKPVLDDVAGSARLAIVQQEPGSAEGEIVHTIRWLLLDAEGRLVSLHRDNSFDIEGLIASVNPP